MQQKKFTFSGIMSKYAIAIPAVFFAGAVLFGAGRCIGRQERQSELDDMKDKVAQAEKMKIDIDLISFQMGAQIEASRVWGIPFTGRCKPSENMLIYSMPVLDPRAEGFVTIGTPSCLAEGGEKPASIHAQQALYLHAAALVKITGNPMLVKMIQNSPAAEINRAGTDKAASDSE